MTLWIPINHDKSVNLQATLAANTADDSLKGGVIGPHHPITCSSTLYLDEDNSQRCAHATTAVDCLRNQAIIDASIAMLLMELAFTNL